MNEILLTIATAIGSSGVTGFFTWIFAKKKYDSEVDNQEIANMKASLEFYTALSDDTKARLNEVLAQNKEILQQNAELIEQNAELKREVSELRALVENLNIKGNGKSSTKKNSQEA